MKGYADIVSVIGALILIVFLLAIASNINQNNCSNLQSELDQAKNDLQKARNGNDILRSENENLKNLLSTCNSNLNTCNDNLTKSMNETDTCKQELTQVKKEFLNKNTTFSIILFLSNIMAIVNILKQLQKIPEKMKNEDWFWLVISVLIILFSVISLIY